MDRFNSYIIRHAQDQSPAFCPKCVQDKPMSMYYAHSKRLDGATRYRPYCKDCRRRGPRSHWPRPKHAAMVNSGVQTCYVCLEEKSLDDFYRNGCFPDGTPKYRSRCKPCVLDLSKAKSPVLYKTKAEKRSLSPKNFISGVLNHAATRKQHLGFDIDLIYLLGLYTEQQGRCAISGAEMTYSAGNGRTYTNISLDRIDSAKGYMRGNVQFVCDIVNRMKSDLTQAAFLDWCRVLVEYNDGDI